MDWPIEEQTEAGGRAVACDEKFECEESALTTLSSSIASMRPIGAVLRTCLCGEEGGVVRRLLAARPLIVCCEWFTFVVFVTGAELHVRM
jgi:hypothetical protein